jgi:hypothetical protein
MLWISIISRDQLVETSSIETMIAIDSAASEQLPLALVSDFLGKCLLHALETCDMCSLCQNGAVCKQTIKNPNHRHTTTSNVPSNGQTKLAFMRNLIDFVCYCIPGYAGRYCQNDIDECMSMPCYNNASCVDRINAYECKCTYGFGGERCEVNLSECDSSQNCEIKIK